MKKLLAALMLAPCLALAQTYPAKPVRLIVPFPAGGTTDLVARVVQAKFQEHLGQTVVIENKGGAGGSIGAAEAAKSAPDGYTLLMGTSGSIAISPNMNKVPYEPLKDLIPITQTSGQSCCWWCTRQCPSIRSRIFLQRQRRSRKN